MRWHPGVVMAVGLVVAFGSPAGSVPVDELDPCSLANDAAGPDAPPAPSFHPGEDSFADPMPQPVLVSQELRVTPGARVMSIEPHAEMDTPCGVQRFSQVMFSDGSRFLLEPGVDRVEQSHPAGTFLVTFGSSR